MKMIANVFICLLCALREFIVTQGCPIRWKFADAYRILLFFRHDFFISLATVPAACCMFRIRAMTE